MRRGEVLALLGLAVGAGCAGDAGKAGIAPCVSVAVTPKMAPAPATLSAHANPTGEGGPWTIDWVVTRDGTMAQFHAVDDTTISIDAPDPGDYHVTATASFNGMTCTSSDDATVTGLGPTQAYRLRFTPPPGSGLPRQERVVVMHAGTPLDHQQLALEAAQPVAAKVLGPVNGMTAGVAGTVRFVSDAGLDVLAATLPDGTLSANLLASDRYTVIVVPLVDGIAPKQVAHDLGAAAAAWQFTLDAGVAIGGTVLDENGQPVTGARVVLSAGSLPSTVGITNAQGLFSVRAEAGSYGVTVQADGLPEIHGPALAVDGGAMLAIALHGARLPVGGKVIGSDGQTAVAGARVWVRSSAALPGLATVTLGNQTVNADGAVRLSLTSGPDGALPPLLLPAADYDVLVDPPLGPSDGATQLHFTVAQAATFRLALRQRSELVGTVTDGHAVVPGVRVMAIEAGVTGDAPATMTDMSGSFRLRVDTGVPADLVFDPPRFDDPNRRLLRTHVAIAAGASPGEVALKTGLLFRGTVSPPAGSPLGGALVEAWCLGPCATDSPTGVASTSADGTFTLILPDPGAAP
jgi:hypothetical protein